MPTFTYIAKRPDGAETRGSINAASLDAAREELRKQGLLIEDIRPQNQPKPQQPQQQKPQQQSPQKPAQPKQPQQQKPQQPRPAQPQQKPQQPKQQPAAQPARPATPVATMPSKPAPLPWSGANNGAAPRMPEQPEYAPLHETLRIFAGWLLAWYGLIYALGFLEESGKLPAVPFIRELFASPLVLQFTFGTFLLLALSNVHRWIGKGILAGFFLAMVYAAGLAGFVIYG